MKEGGAKERKKREKMREQDGRCERKGEGGREGKACTEKGKLRKRT